MKATPDQQQQILRLAQLDQELSVGSAQLRHLREGAEIAAIRTELIQSSERLLEGRTELENITAELKRSESDLELVEKRIAQDNERLLTVSSHKDADGISHELVSLKARLSNLEDVELEIMERRDAATAALETLTAERADIAQKLSVAEAAAGLPSLVFLDLGGCGVGPAGAAALAAALPTMAALKDLELDYNKLGDAGAEALAAGLASAKALVIVDVRYNGIGEAALASAIAKLPTGAQARSQPQVRD
jgi:hypothetical protein